MQASSDPQGLFKVLLEEALPGLMKKYWRFASESVSNRVWSKDHQSMCAGSAFGQYFQVSRRSSNAGLDEHHWLGRHLGV